MTEYAGASHVFDWPMLKTPVTLAQAQATRRCRLEEAAGGWIVDSQTGQPFTNASDPCVEKGATMVYDADAHVQALGAVKEFIGATLQPR